MQNIQSLIESNINEAISKGYNREFMQLYFSPYLRDVLVDDMHKISNPNSMQITQYMGIPTEILGKGLSFLLCYIEGIGSQPELLTGYLSNLIGHEKNKHMNLW